MSRSLIRSGIAALLSALPAMAARADGRAGRTDRRRSEAVRGRSRAAAARSVDRLGTCELGQRDVHHRRHRGVDLAGDVRIRMCIEINASDFATVHHELGHNYYDRAYARQPLLFRSGASDAFHEAVGDAIELSVTPAYLVKLGFIGAEPDASRDTGLLLQRALGKIAFLPFGLLVDQWRWQVFSGEVAPSQYNAAWWALRLKYQGIAPPLPRSEADFDPGAKFHIPANVPYMRYFLSNILQFQFHRALAQAAGCTAPLHRCSIHGNAAAGAKLRAMLALGRSRPWPDALEALTGQRRIDASALLDYFAPLKAWLDAQNAGKPVDWLAPQAARP